METYTLRVPSIGCQGCMNNIVKRLQTLSGVKVVETTMATKSLLLYYVPQEISTRHIDDAIRDLGHQVATEEAPQAATSE